METMTIRAATEGDIEGLRALYRAFHSFHVRGVPERLREPEQDDAETVRAALRALLGREDAALFVAEAPPEQKGDEEPRLLGLVEVYLKRDEPHPATVSYIYGYVQSLMVAEAMRHQRLGRRLMAAAEAWAREHGATQLRLDAWEFPAGPLPFYEKLGFRTVKRTLARDL